MTARTIFLWRHGRTAHNQRRIWQGQLDVPLDEVGRQQAVEAAPMLLQDLRKATPGDDLTSQVKIVSSDLSRAFDTAQALSQLTGVPVTAEKGLREIDVGVWQGRTRDEIIADGMGDQLQAWRDGEDIPLGGGERRSEVGLRGSRAVNEHAESLDDGTLVVVSHGAMISGVIATLLGLGSDRWGFLGVIDNAHWARLIRSDRGWRLAAYNLGP